MHGLAQDTGMTQEQAGVAGDHLTRHEPKRMLCKLLIESTCLQAEELNLHFLIRQCPAGKRVLNTTGSMSGSRALLIMGATPDPTLAVDFFPHCIGKPSR